LPIIIDTSAIASPAKKTHPEAIFQSEYEKI
jgi:hypothetical protein